MCNISGLVVPLFVKCQVESLGQGADLEEPQPKCQVHPRPHEQHQHWHAPYPTTQDSQDVIELLHECASLAVTRSRFHCRFVTTL